MSTTDRAAGKKLENLERLINEPLLRPQIPDRLYNAITAEVANYRKGGVEAISEQLREHLDSLVERFESQLSGLLNQPPIFLSARKGSQKEVLQLLSAGFDINEKDADGLTLLMIAASNGDTTLAASLLDRGADIAATCEQQNDFDAMMMACAAGHADVATLLLDHGVDVNKRYAPGSSHGRIGNQTALSFAANRGRVDVCRLLVNRGADMEVVSDSGYTALMWALTNGASEEAAELLLELGANPDPGSTPIDAYAQALSTPLILAASNGLSRVASKLITAGVDLDRTDYAGWTALKHASHGDHHEIVRLLIEAGADLDQPDGEGWTPLITAASRASWAPMELLINAGANVNHQTDGGNTALREVIGRRLLRHSMVSLARLTGRELDPQQIVGYSTTIVFAEMLLQKGASPQVAYDQDKSQVLLIDEAMEQRDDELVALLERFGATPSEADENGSANQAAADESSNNTEPTDLLGMLEKMRSNLMDLTSSLRGRVESLAADMPAGDQMIIAASHNNIDAVAEFLEADVDVNHVDSDGDTALGICVSKICAEAELEPDQERDFFELIHLLLEHGAKVDVQGCRVAPLPMVARLGSVDLTNAFLLAGADPEAVMTAMDQDEGKTALELAREYGHVDVEAALLSALE